MSFSYEQQKWEEIRYVDWKSVLSFYTLLVPFPVAVIKYSWKKQVGGERIYYGSQFKSTVHKSKEVKAPGA